MLQITAHQHHIVLAQYFYAIAHNTSCTIAVLHKVEFHGLVLVQWVGECFLFAIHHIEAVFL